MLVKVGIRKLGWWKVFGDEDFGECRARHWDLVFGLVVEVLRMSRVYLGVILLGNS